MRDAADRANKGQIDADLDGKVINSGSPDRGREDRKATGDHFSRRGAKAFFVYGFPRASANIDDGEEKQFEEAATHVLALAEKQLAELLERGHFVEVRAK